MTQATLELYVATTAVRDSRDKIHTHPRALPRTTKTCGLFTCSWSLSKAPTTPPSPMKKQSMYAAPTPASLTHSLRDRSVAKSKNQKKYKKEDGTTFPENYRKRKHKNATNNRSHKQKIKIKTERARTQARYVIIIIPHALK